MRQNGAGGDAGGHVLGYQAIACSLLSSTALWYHSSALSHAPNANCGLGLSRRAWILTPSRCSVSLDYLPMSRNLRLRK